MRAGRLRRRLRLQRPVRTQSATGAVTTTWTTVATVWGAVEPVRGKDVLPGDDTTGGQVSSEVRVMGYIRYGAGWADIGPSWRIVDANTSRSYEIISSLPQEGRSRPETLIELVLKVGKGSDR